MIQQRYITEKRIHPYTGKEIFVSVLTHENVNRKYLEDTFEDVAFIKSLERIKMEELENTIDTIEHKPLIFFKYEGFHYALPIHLILTYRSDLIFT